MVKVNGKYITKEEFRLWLTANLNAYRDMKKEQKKLEKTRRDFE